MLEAQGSVLTNKYAEGYPGKRYYGGCEYVDIAEQLAIDRAQASCSARPTRTCSRIPARRRTPLRTWRCIKPGDTILGMSLDHGGHLTHGAKVNFSGKLFKAVQYGLDPNTGEIDYEQVEQLAQEHRPRMIIAGFSAYSRVIDWERFRRIADAVGAYFVVDMAHVAGLVAAGIYPNPVPHADVVTTTTHKTLRGPRGGLILARPNDEIHKKLNSLVFPGTQGGPLMHVIAAKAVALLEALQPEFIAYQKQVLANARAMAAALMKRGYKIVSGGTDNHLFLRRPDRQEHHRQGCGRRARPRAHHRQQERRAERSAAAVRHERPAHRHAGRDDARLQGSAKCWSSPTGSPTCSMTNLQRRGDRARCRRQGDRDLSAGSRSTAVSSTSAHAACIARSAITKRRRSSIRASPAKGSRSAVAASACSAASASRPSRPRSW